MASVASKQSVEDRLYDLLDRTVDALVQRVESAGTDEDNPPLTPAEIGVITALLKNNGISSSGAKGRSGKLKPLTTVLPTFTPRDDGGLDVPGGR